MNDVYIDGNICVVDLGSRINEVNDPTISPEVVLYAIVDSLMESSELEGVRILIDGSDKERLRSQISLDQVFTANHDVVMSLAEMVEEKD